MLSAKRVLIATVCGFVFGLICVTLASSSPDPTNQLTVGIKLSIVFGRTLMGFMIGISALQLSWWLHGLFIGLLTSIPMAFPTMDQPMIFAWTIIMGLIYGILTELITTVFFKAKAVE